MREACSILGCEEPSVDFIIFPVDPDYPSKAWMCAKHYDDFARTILAERKRLAER
jgi:hypothetical protein